MQVIEYDLLTRNIVKNSSHELLINYQINTTLQQKNWNSKNITENPNKKIFNNTSSKALNFKKNISETKKKLPFAIWQYSQRSVKL